jgi:hypothetical protein
MQHAWKLFYFAFIFTILFVEEVNGRGNRLEDAQAFFGVALLFLVHFSPLPSELELLNNHGGRGTE